jgi:hypothetical protein
VVHPQPSVSVGVPEQNALSRSTLKASKPLSQEKLKANDLTSNKTLSFQVVKDPQDPETIKDSASKAAHR